MKATTTNPPSFHFGAALGTALTTLVTFVIAVFTPPLSGPFCQANCIAYPYLAIADRFPRDYIWMFPAIVATLFFVALMVALHDRAASSQKPLASLAVVLAAMAALVIVGDYFVQLAVVQPSVLAGETDGISLLTQYNPHGLFIALEELGYVLVSVSLALIAPVLLRSSPLERRVGWGFVIALVVNVVAFGVIAARLGHAREYVFELAVISVDWLVLIVAGFVLAVVFRRELVAARALERS